MSRTDDELRSVRVEVETHDFTDLTAPSVEPAAGSRPLVAAGVVVALLFALAFLFLRPASNEAADGSQRIAPTTTIPIESDAVPDSTTTTTTTTTSTTPTNPESSLVGVISDPDFTAAQAAAQTLQLAESIEAGGSPEIVVPELERVGVRVSDEVLLEEILRFDDAGTAGVDGRGCDEFEGSAEETFLSECGQFSTADQAGAGQDEQVGSVGLGAPELNNSGPAFGECVAIASALTIPGFFIFGTSDAEGDETSEDGGGVVEEADQSGEETDSVTSARSEFAFASNGLVPEITPLPNGRVAVVDPGTIGVNASCDAAGGFFRRGGGVVLIDPSLDTATTFEAPLPLLPSLSGAGVVEILGEFAVGDARSHLFVMVDRGLWSIDTANGEWSLLDNSSNMDSPYALSTSGTRLYRIVDVTVEAVGLSANADGSLRFDATISPILNGITQRLVGDSAIRFATDDAIFVANGANTWRLPIPERPDPNG